MLWLVPAFLALGGCAFALWRPPPGTTWQWQLTGRLDTGVAAEAYDIDGFDTPASTVARLHARGRKAICYISVGAWERWRPDAASFPASVRGVSNGWPGERWLDIRRIDVLGPILTRRFRMCAAKGFDAVEPDNVDGYANVTGFPLTPGDQLAFNRWVARAVHAQGMSVALKNDVDQTAALEPAFDFAVNEQCFRYAECAPLSRFVAHGKAVLQVEYELATSRFCRRAVALRFSSMRKRLALDAWRQAC